jgi:pyridoxal phosphate enzyme (YggS family)
VWSGGAASALPRGPKKSFAVARPDDEMSFRRMSITANLEAIRQRMERAACRAGRASGSIRLMAVSKTFPAEAVREAYAAGQRLFGENRVQEFADKAGALAALNDAAFHMIGHLQSNKAAKAVEIFQAVDSLDSAKLAARLNAAAAAVGKVLPALIEINIGGEEAKSGVAPASPELSEILNGAAAWPNVRIRGLMTVPPWSEDPEPARPYFRKLRELRDQLAARNLAGLSFEELSMGMSNDFEVAIEEGSTCVRVGTAIFGKRPKPK